MHKLLKLSISATAFAAPMFVLAQTNGIQNLINSAKGIVASLVPLIIGIAVLTFLWGVLKYIVAKEDEDKKAARDVMLYGIIALFVMVSVWGLVGILGDTIGVQRGGTSGVNPPGIPGISR